MDANPNPSGRGDQSASVSAGLPEAERPELHQTQSRWLVGSRTRSRTPPHGRVVPRWPGGQTGSRSFIQGGSEASQTTVLDGREKRRAEKSREEKRREEQKRAEKRREEQRREEQRRAEKRREEKRREWLGSDRDVHIHKRTFSNVSETRVLLSSILGPGMQPGDGPGQE